MMDMEEYKRNIGIITSRYDQYMAKLVDIMKQLPAAERNEFIGLLIEGDITVTRTKIAELDNAHFYLLMLHLRVAAGVSSLEFAKEHLQEHGKQSGSS